LVGLGDHSWEIVSARRTRSRLIDISARLTNLTQNVNGALVTRMDDYLAKRSHTAADWQDVAGAISESLTRVTGLLTALQSEHSDFVLQPAYQTLIRTLGTRDLYLSRLAHIPPPTTADELDALRTVDANYKILISNTATAINEMNKYVSSTGTT
jgi:hypothetical protein